MSSPSYSYQKKYDAVIIGAGVIGCSIAFFLARESKGKFKVALVDRNIVGDEASGGAAGMLAAQIETEAPGPFLDLQIQSREIFKGLVGELEGMTGIPLHYEKKGILDLAVTPEHEHNLRARFKWQKASGLAIEWMSGEEISRAYPFIKKKVFGGLFAPEDAQISAPHWVRALGEAAKKLGADIYESEGIEDLVLNPPRQDFLETILSKFTAEHFIFAAGAWMGRLLSGRVPIEPVKGQILIYETPAGWAEAKGWRTPIFCGKIPGPNSALSYMLPKSGNEVWLGTTAEKRGLDKSENLEATHQISKYWTEFLPELSTFKLKSVWTGLRPGTSDDLPILGLLPGFENIHVAGGHYRNGILLSAVTGKIFADILLKGQSSFNLTPFSPNRFAETTV